MWQAWGEVRCIQHLTDRIILKWILKKQDRRAWTRFMAQDGGTGKLLKLWRWTFGFHKTRANSWLSKETKDSAIWNWVTLSEDQRTVARIKSNRRGTKDLKFWQKIFFFFFLLFCSIWSDFRMYNLRCELDRVRQQAKTRVMRYFGVFFSGGILTQTSTTLSIRKNRFWGDPSGSTFLSTYSHWANEVESTIPVEWKCELCLAASSWDMLDRLV
jgi:hypothetical protein